MIAFIGTSLGDTSINKFKPRGSADPVKLIFITGLVQKIPTNILCNLKGIIIVDF